MDMKKIVAFEYGDENQNYTRVSFRVDLRVCLAVLACFVLLVFSLVFGLKSPNPQVVSCFHQGLGTSIRVKDAQHFIASKINDFSAINQEKETVTKEASVSSIDQKLNFIRNMAIEAWNQIHKENSEIKSLDTIQMLSTLWVMGLKEEYEQGKEWIDDNFNKDDSHLLQYTFVVATEYMGSLLSCYALTNDTSLLGKAKFIGDVLQMEFDTRTGLPRKILSKRGFTSSIHLAEAGGQHLEFGYLSGLTKDSNLKAKLKKARTFLQNMPKVNGLYMQDLSIDTGHWESTTSTLFWPAHVFYQYLVKSYVQSNRRDTQPIEMYKQAMDAVVNNSLITKSKGGLTFARNYLVDEDWKQHSTYMESDGCYLGAMLALGANAMQRNLAESKLIDVHTRKSEQARIDQHWTLAKAITETCHTASNRTKTKIVPRMIGFRNYSSEAANLGGRVSFESISAIAESYFVLWRLTHDVKYRDYAWELAEAIYKQCRDKGQYWELPDVDQDYININGVPKLHFLSSTLKYLYLTFADDTLLPLDKWVFNRVGQPLPVCGKNEAYVKCSY